jgi:hypothetical protein
METQQTQPPVLKLSWREKFAGILLLIIGLVYLLWQASDFLSSKADAYTTKEGAIHISTSELMNHVRSIISILLAIAGGWLLLKGKRAGWVIAVPILLLLNAIAAGIMIANYSLTNTNNKIVGGSFVFLLLLALVFLLLPSARVKYKVGKLTYLPTLILLFFLVALYFFLQ